MDVPVTVHYERKFSDGNYGSEGLSMTWTVNYEDDSDFAADRETVVARCAVITESLREAVLSELARSASWSVASAAKHELEGPPEPTPQEAAADRAMGELEDIPF